jgi:hypothetical protein
MYEQRREINLVALETVELPTSSLGNCCSIHLSYSPAFDTAALGYLRNPRRIKAQAS